MADAAAMMSSVSPKKMIARVKLMFSNPQAYWADIAGDQGGIRALLPTVVFFVAAATIAQFVGSYLLLPLRLGWLSLLPRFLIGGVVHLVLGVPLGVAAWYVMTIIIEKLGKNFGAQTATVETASKAALGSLIPMWLGQLLSITSLGILNLIGGLGGLGFGCYLMYLGVQQLLGTPQEKATAYTATVMVITFVIMIVIGAVVGGVTGAIASPV